MLRSGALWSGLRHEDADPGTRREFHDLVRLTDVDDTTILLTTHDPDEGEQPAERIIADGSAGELSRRVGRESAAGRLRDGS